MFVDDHIMSTDRCPARVNTSLTSCNQIVDGVCDDEARRLQRDSIRRERNRDPAVVIEMNFAGNPLLLLVFSGMLRAPCRRRHWR